MTRVNSLLELTDVRNRWRKESGIYTNEMIKLEIFSTNLHLKLSSMLQFGSRSKTSAAKFDNSFNLWLEQRLPKWRFTESSSSRLEQSLSKLCFIRSSNLGQVKSYTLKVYFVRLQVAHKNCDLGIKCKILS